VRQNAVARRRARAIRLEWARPPRTSVGPYQCGNCVVGRRMPHPPLKLALLDGKLSALPGVLRLDVRAPVRRAHLDDSAAAARWVAWPA
jgi:hypothetical protein